jgi:putative phosphoesterase
MNGHPERGWNMRIGLIGDIHGNLVALDTVLAALAAARPDRIVCLGDIATTGPQPHECVARIRDLRCPTVQGNWDAWMVDVRTGKRSYDDCRDIDRWSAEQLGDGDLEYLNGLPLTLEMPLDAQATLLCFHGSPLNYNQGIEPGTADEALAEMLGGWSATVMACGHTHNQMLRRLDGGFLINPGSISECWDFTVHVDEKPFSPWAEFGVIDWSDNQLGMALHRVPIDVEAVIHGALSTGMAGAAEWTARWVKVGGATSHLR